MMFGIGYRESTVDPPRRAWPLAVVRSVRYLGHVALGVAVLACGMCLLWLAGPGAVRIGFFMGQFLLGHEFQHGWALPPGELGAWAFGLICLIAPFTTVPPGRWASVELLEWWRK